jgi:uncharacterized membrane protein YjfL (UPF0719 family)
MTEHLAQGLVAALLFSLVGIGVFSVAFFIIAKVSPLSLRKEIEQDQNTALGVLIGSIIIGLSLIISAAIHG